MGTSYYAELTIAVPVSLTELMFSDVKISCENGHTCSENTAIKTCSICGYKINRNVEEVPTANYAAYIEEMDFYEEFIFSVSEDVLPNSKNKKLIPRLQVIQPHHHYSGSIEKYGFGINIFNLCVGYGDKEKNSLSQEDITKYFNIVRDAAIKLKLQKTEPRIYMSVVGY